jgi:hypothetical protein
MTATISVLNTTASSKRCCKCKQTKPIDLFHRSAAHGGFAPRCKPCAIEVAREWYFANKAKKRQYDGARRKAQPDRYRAASKRFREAHPDVKNIDTSVRRRRARQQTPKWTTLKQLRCFYAAASRVSKCLGVAHHVDHIYPLRGRTISGLHVANNLQILPAVQNLQKRNSFNFEHNGVK